jgi:hypothetical protein
LRPTARETWVVVGRGGEGVAVEVATHEPQSEVVTQAGPWLPGRAQVVYVRVEAQEEPLGVTQLVLGGRVGRLVGLKVSREVVVFSGSSSEMVVVLVRRSTQDSVGSSMVTVLVRRSTQEPLATVVLVVPVTEQPDVTTLLKVVQEGEPGAVPVVVQETAKLVTVAVEQLAVDVMSESVT